MCSTSLADDSWSTLTGCRDNSTAETRVPEIITYCHIFVIIIMIIAILATYSITI